MQFSMTWIIAAVVVALAVFAIVMFNRLIGVRNMVREAWSGIDVQLRRRSDLIPNLVETVRAYAGHERGVFDGITGARRRSGGASRRPRSETALRARLPAAGRQAYPQLKADQNFSSCRPSVEIETSCRWRGATHGTVRDFNIAIQTFPDVLIAHAAGMHEEHFFETDAASRIAPTVSLSGA